MKEKSVSIILPNFNSSKYIYETIFSVLNQSYKKWKLIIVDDCSDSKTKSILKKFKKHKKIKIFFLKKNMGTAYCRNFAIKNSKSYYLAFIDSDDVWLKDKMKKQIYFMEKNNYNFSHTNYYSFKDGNKKLKKIFTPSKINFHDFTKNTSIGTSTMIIKRSVAKNIKFTSTKICEDYFYKCLLLKRINYSFRLNSFQTKYRIRKDSLQSNRLKNLFWIWKINNKYNNFNFVQNLLSVFFISINSLKKYGFK
tara:strand:+ start:736 stop:1488 length:753 start_codon:yes stop_codon:yes gene_type:complete